MFTTQLRCNNYIVRIKYLKPTTTNTPNVGYLDTHMDQLTLNVIWSALVVFFIRPPIKARGQLNSSPNYYISRTLYCNITMKYLFGKSVVFILVLARSRCAPGRLGTIDRFIPDFSVTDDDDELYKVTSDETEDHTWSYYEDDDVADTTTNKIPLESLVAHIDQLAGNNGTTKGQYVYTDKTGNSITVVYVAGPSSSFAAHTAADKIKLDTSLL